MTATTGSKEQYGTLRKLIGAGFEALTFEGPARARAQINEILAPISDEALYDLWQVAKTPVADGADGYCIATDYSGVATLIRRELIRRAVVSGSGSVHKLIEELLNDELAAIFDGVAVSSERDDAGDAYDHFLCTVGDTAFSLNVYGGWPAF